MNNPKRMRIEGFNVAGCSVITANKDEMLLATAKLPGLWNDFFTHNRAEQIPHRQSDSAIMGVYTDYESDEMGYYKVTAGVPVTELSPGMVQIQAGDYLVFEGTGTFPEVVIELWQTIWRYFKENKQIKRAFTSDFEVYQNTTQCMIYIGVSAVNGQVI